MKINMLSRAIEIAASAHAGQVDKGNQPYILHPLWVMNKVRHLGEDYMIVAVLHDVIEDTEWNYVMLEEHGFSDKIIDALKLLDKNTWTPCTYDDYIKSIALNPIAKAVKLRDLEHNTKVTRLKGLRKKDFDRIEKYHKAYTYLKD